MREKKLILVDGLPGSGKSSTAEFLADQFDGSGIPAEWIWETEKGHPFHVWGDFSHEWFDGLEARDAGDLIEGSLAKWLAFVEAKAAAEGVTVVDGFPFQSAVLFLLLMDAGEADVAGYVRRLAEVVAPLGPILIYFHHADAAEAMRKSVAERGGWFRDLLQKINVTPYGCRRGLTGEGYLTFFTEYKALTDSLFADWPLPKLVLEAGGGWPERRRQVLDRLGLPPAEEIAFAPEDYVGRYQEEGGEEVYAVTWEDGTLTIRLYHIISKMVPKSTDNFSLSGFGYSFKRGADGTVQRLTVRTKDDVFRSARRLV